MLHFFKTTKFLLKTREILRGPSGKRNGQTFRKFLKFPERETYLHLEILKIEN